jgi:spore germination protein
LFIKLAARFPNLGYFQYLQIVWGKPLGFLISILYLLFWVSFLSSIFYETILTNKLLFLPRTPTIVPLAIFALALIWLVSYGLIPIIRFFQLLLPFLVIPLLLLALLFMTAIKIDRFSPVLENGILPVLKGSYLSLGAFQGPEVLLFVAPFFLRIREGVKSSLFAYYITVFFGLSNTIAAIGILGVDNINEAILPGINVVNLLEFPGFPAERFGLLLTLPWLIAIFTTLAINLYLLCSSTFQLFNLHHKKWKIFLITAIPVTISYFLPNENWHEALRLYLTILTVPIVYLLPVMTLLLAIIRKKGRVT